MNILRISCSPRGPASESYRLSQTVISHLAQRHRGSEVIITERGAGALAHVDVDYAETLGKRRDPADALVNSGTLGQAEQLVRELEGADCLVIATPMHNFTVPSALKAWLDHVIQAGRTFHITPEGKVGTLRDRPVFIAISSGGLFSAANAQQPDFLTPYLKVALRTIGLQDLTFFSVEGTAHGESAVQVARANTEREMALHFRSLP